MAEIRSLMTKDVIAFRESTPIVEALQCLIDNQISGAPVICSDRRIVGVISEADLLSIFWKTNVTTVGEIMTPSPVCMSVDKPLVDVVDCLMSNNFRRVLIHDQQQRLVGLISRADLMPAILDELIGRIKGAGA